MWEMDIRQISFLSIKLIDRLIVYSFLLNRDMKFHVLTVVFSLYYLTLHLHYIRQFYCNLCQRNKNCKILDFSQKRVRCFSLFRSYTRYRFLVEMMICTVTQHFSLNRIILLSIGLWPYQHSKLNQLHIILCFGILISSVLYQVGIHIFNCIP